MQTKTEQKAYDRARYLKIRAERRSLHPDSPDPMDRLGCAEIAYLAGLLDGEGCITISGTRIGTFIPLVSFIMTHRGVLEWVAEKLAVPCRPRKIKSAKPHWKPQYQVVVTGKRAVRLMKLLHPYLIVKLFQAELMIEFGATYNHEPGSSNHAVAPLTVAARARIKVEISLLNDRRRKAADQ